VNLADPDGRDAQWAEDGYNITVTVTAQISLLDALPYSGYMGSELAYIDGVPINRGYVGPSLDYIKQGLEIVNAALNQSSAVSQRTRPESTSVISRMGRKICSAIPSGRVIGVSGGIGGVGSVEGGGEIVVNYDSGQVSAFGFGGVQAGWNGGLSGTAYIGFVYGLNESNSNDSGGFSGFNAAMGTGVFWVSSSGGLTNGIGGTVPAGDVTAAGFSVGAGVLGPVSGGVTVTGYTRPQQMGRYWGFSPLDMLISSVRQLCK
jgi:hypothetical protein